MAIRLLRESQLDAVKKMHNGCILCGGVGSGKSRTSLAYYFTQYGGDLDSDNWKDMKDPPDLYIITTAKKRDNYEWDVEMASFHLCRNDAKMKPRIYHNNVTVDSWNNISKYRDVENAFFIFDEQRVVGYGAWVKSFIKITRHNKWILLSATPGDKWEDYIPVFIANGFFRNKTEFNNEHVVFAKFVKFPKIEKYLNIGRLMRLRDRILVEMEVERDQIQHHIDIPVNYDVATYKWICRNRWDPYTEEPLENASSFCYLIRKVVNSDQSREVAVLELLEEHPKAIIFYNFDYELEILRDLCENNGYKYAEWNGHKHQDCPGLDDGSKWVYLVQYTAGAEGWNCIYTDTIIFYSQNYSYKVMVQAAGRIDRMNTPYRDLYYFHLKSSSGIDKAIDKALKDKKKFNEKRFYDGRR